MPENKLKEFKRESVDRVYKEFIDRVKHIFVNREEHIDVIKYICVFGSYVNSDKPRIHDLDIVIDTHLRPGISTEDFRKYIIGIENKYFEEGKYISPHDAIDYHRNEILVALRNNSKMISFHDVYDLNVALQDKHIWIVKDCKLIDNPVVEEGMNKEEIHKLYEFLK